MSDLLTTGTSVQFQKVAYILGISLIVGLTILGVNINQGRVNNTISVTGSVKQSVLSDQGIWRATLIANASLFDTRQQLDVLARQANEVKLHALSLGFKADEITIDPAQSNVRYEQLPDYRQSQNPVGYNLRQTIKVVSSNVDLISKLAQAQGSLVDKGATFDGVYTEYYYTKLAALRPKLFAEATRDAKARAEAIASGTGNKVGALRSARTGVIQVLAPNSNDISDYGTYDLSTKAKEVSAVVSASFELR